MPQHRKRKISVHTEIWVKAYLRRCFAFGLTGVVSRRGDSKAGSVFVRVFSDKENVRLLCPAPGESLDARGERRWLSVSGLTPMSAEAADEYLEKQIRYDPDIWVVDVDDKAGSGLLDFTS